MRRKNGGWWLVDTTGSHVSWLDVAELAGGGTGIGDKNSGETVVRWLMPKI